MREGFPFAPFGVLKVYKIAYTHFGDDDINTVSDFDGNQLTFETKNDAKEYVLSELNYGQYWILAVG